MVSRSNRNGCSTFYSGGASKREKDTNVKVMSASPAVKPKDLLARGLQQRPRTNTSFKRNQISHILDAIPLDVHVESFVSVGPTEIASQRRTPIPGLHKSRVSNFFCLWCKGLHQEFLFPCFGLWHTRYCVFCIFRSLGGSSSDPCWFLVLRLSFMKMNCGGLEVCVNHNK